MEGAKAKEHSVKRFVVVLGVAFVALALLFVVVLPRAVTSGAGEDAEMTAAQCQLALLRARGG